ncbi:hypothetical protein [Yinghuangia seranimata]|nr:hypothetical protein [Yinghuangia seranimata]MDI2125422.1 hypothetical protein [Yinghuangia seranimata]
MPCGSGPKRKRQYEHIAESARKRRDIKGRSSTPNAESRHARGR